MDRLQGDELLQAIAPLLRRRHLDVEPRPEHPLELAECSRPERVKHRLDGRGQAHSGSFARAASRSRKASFAAFQPPKRVT